jgi:cysteinyl-tRNA synthetase
MALSLHNTLSQQTHALQRNSEGTFRYYCCGPTVYGAAHIGNFRTFVLQDVLRRLLELESFNPIHVRNITDVDDKTIRQSQSEGKTLRAFTKHWQQIFEEDCQTLSLLPPHQSPSVADHIPHQVELIERLIENGHAYEASDGVYFKVASFPTYGALAHLDLETLASQSTNSAGDQNRADEYTKENIADFALWKKHKPEDGENAWPSPWGDGRPGWHIECSAMCVAHLGPTIDLHGGGIDLIFPHHVNEIAQSEGATGKPFCQHWFHIAHLKVEGEKMSKSLGNLYTLRDLMAKGYSAEAVRYLLLSGHYRQPLNFTFEGLHAATKALERIDQFIHKLLQKNNLTANEWELLPMDWAALYFKAAREALCDDLKTPQALGALFSECHQLESEGKADVAILQSLKAVLFALGLKGLQPVMEVVIPESIQALAEKRWQAKQSKDFAASDVLRKELLALGWSVMDEAQGYCLKELNIQK